MILVSAARKTALSRSELENCVFRKLPSSCAQRLYMESAFSHQRASSRLSDYSDKILWLPRLLPSFESLQLLPIIKLTLKRLTDATFRLVFSPVQLTCI